MHKKDPCIDTLPPYSDSYMATDYEGNVNWEELSHLVSPTFADEISPEEKCDTHNRVYGPEFLKSVQGVTELKILFSYCLFPIPARQ